MVRTILSVLFAVLACATIAWPQRALPEDDANRYSFNSADEGYVRLDGRTGQVSLCTRRPPGWECRAVPDERAALEAEIARLQVENAVLKKELLAHNLPLPGSVKSLPPTASSQEPRVQLPSDADLDKMVTFIEKVWRRLVEMIVSLQKGVLNKT